MNTLNPDIPNIPNTPEVGIPLSSGRAQPIVLFPVRLETRFFTLEDGSSELRVRVYPDTVHMDSHEPGLTADELTWGEHFWEQTWRAANNKERAQAAWQQLVERFDAPRAAWIARVLKPLNPIDRPTTPIATDQSLPKPVSFPSPESQAEAWMRAPHTRVLPNRWIVLGYHDGLLVANVTGGVIPDSLATGPHPPGPDSSPAADPPVPDDQLAIDEGMKWMVDFDTAEKVGMAIRIKLTKEAAAVGFDFVLVMGIKDTQDGTTDWSSRLAEQFNAHHYTYGMSFVPPGTPSNNTQDVPSGFSSKDPGHETSYLAERSTPVFQAGDGSNADVLTTAFGLPQADQTFATLSYATAKEQLDARHMNTALWQATWGYFLLQMLGVGHSDESPLTDGDIAWARNHCIDYVRANGPLPAIRIGKQPYGILPVTSLDGWKPEPGSENQSTLDVALRDFLLRLRVLWRGNYPEIPRLGRSEDGAKDLAEVMSMEGLSSSYSVRNLMGRQYLEHLWVYQNSRDLSGFPQEGRFREWFAKQESLTTPVLQKLGVTWRPRLARAAFAPPLAALRGALVQTEHSEFLSTNYIKSLLAAPDIVTIRDETIQPLPTRTLLYLLLRHAMLLEYATAASRLLMNRELLRPEQRREPELVNFATGPSTRTIWDHLKTFISVSDGGEQIELGKHLFEFAQTDQPGVTLEPGLPPLKEFRASLTHLQELPVNRLEQLMTGTLDLCSHRLDAWITSFATKRLAEMRKTNPTGVLIGGYGWVMNLKPAAVQTQVTPPLGEQAPVFQSPTNPGFIHTPSLTQAATVALLRSGHLAHASTEPNGPLAIDLSSERVRLAGWLLDGVRQGQLLGALLGYRFERRLQEVGKAEFIAPLRELAPLVARKMEKPTPVGGSTPAVEQIAANNVVDGLDLLRRWQKGKSATPERWTTDTIPFPNNSENKVLHDALASLEDAVDAVSDALMAESVYHIVRGNPLRAASTVEAIAGGEIPPPELEVMHTPRTGIALTHRLVTLFSGEPTLPAEWSQPQFPYRANAEPQLNAWAGRLLGDPAKVHCVVERLEPTTGEVIDAKELRLSELRLAPLDYIYANEGGQGGQQAEIEQRILFTIMRKPDGFAPGSLLRISPDRKSGWGVSDLSYGEFNVVRRTARRMITAARALEAEDLNLPERTVGFSMVVDELEARARSASDRFNELRQLLTNSASASVESLGDSLLQATTFGVAGAVPLSTAGDQTTDRDILLVQATSVEKELRQRFDQLTALGANAATPESRATLALAQLHTIFGKAFVVLPRFIVENAAELAQALSNSAKLLDNDSLAVPTWFQRMGRVRDGVARLNDMLQYAEALKTGEQLNLTIAQLPFNTEDRWVGLPLKPGQTLPGGKLSLAVQSSTAINVSQPLTGLLIDEWVEVVPNAKETTAIALQYDQPNSAPPQTILIAVPPEVGVPWTVWSLQKVLLETLDLARIRAVDPDALDEIGHYLPALYFALNVAGDTVSTDFSRIR